MPKNKDFIELSDKELDEKIEEADGGSYNYRNWTTDDTYCDDTPGKIVTGNRTFGVEIECGAPNEQQAAQMSEVIPQSAGMGRDGGHEFSVEIQTPPLKGARGERFLHQTSKLLQKLDFSIGSNCGCHVHIGMKDFAGKNPEKRLRDVWMFWLIYEDVILSFLPKSRRLNSYCTPLKNQFQLAEISRCNTLEELEAIWYRTNDPAILKARKSDKKAGSRYYGYNLQCFFATGILEIRYHSGTINSRKMLEWINLQMAIIDRANGSTANTQANNLSIEDKTNLLFNNLRLSKASETYWRSRQILFKDETTHAFLKRGNIAAVEKAVRERKEKEIEQEVNILTAVNLPELCVE